MEEYVFLTSDLESYISGFLLITHYKNFQVHHLLWAVIWIVLVAAFEHDSHGQVIFDGDVVTVLDTWVQIVNVLRINERQKSSSFFRILLLGLHIVFKFLIIIN